MGQGGAGLESGDTGGQEGGEVLGDRGGRADQGCRPQRVGGYGGRSLVPAAGPQVLEGGCGGLVAVAAGEVLGEVVAACAHIADVQGEFRPGEVDRAVGVLADGQGRGDHDVG